MKHSICVLLLCMASGLFAQEPRLLTLEETIRLGITNSKQLKAGAAKIDEATAALREAMDQRLPTASVTGAYLRLNSANVDLKSSGNSGSGTGTGTAPKVSQAMYGLVNLSLPVYAGGRIRYGIEAYTYLQQAARLDAENEKDAVILNTIESFANLFKAGTAVRLVKENLQQSQQRVKELEDLEKNGLLTRNDLLKARLQSSAIELNLLDAENNLALANLSMDLLLGLPDSTTLVPDTTGITRKEDSRVLADYLKSARESRYDRNAMSFRTRAAATQVKAVKAEKLPSLQLTGGYIAADIPKLLSVTNAVNVGMGVSYNISTLWKNKARLQQATAKLSQSELANEMLDENIRLQVSKAYLSLMSLRKKIEVYAVSDEQARENYRIVKNKFDNKLATLSELLEADVSQLQAGMSFTLARADAFVAYHKLLLSAGLLAKELKK
ncbi:MAG: TolC family protein [Sphingobacteriales bacterium]|nr:TolC family protein [Sphingobacteriales bacterium]